MKKIVFFISLTLGAGALTIAQDKFFVHTSTGETISVTGTFIDHPDLNNNPNANFIVSHCWDCSGTGVDNNKVSGIYYSNTDNKWMIFNEDGSDMEAGRSFFVYIPLDGYSFRTTNSGNSTYLYLDNALLNGQPEKSAVLTNLYLSQWDNRNYGFWYDTDVNQWVVYNEGLANIEANASYIVAMEGDPGIEKYRHSATSENSYSDCTELNHPILNGNPNAKMVFAHNWGVSGDVSNIILDKVFTVFYNDATASWRLCTEDYTDIPPGTMFDFLISGNNVNVNDLTHAGKVTVFPNPVTDNVNFNSQNIIHEITVYDMSGTEMLNAQQSSENVQMNISVLPVGVYIAKIKTSKGIETLKLIKK